MANRHRQLPQRPQASLRRWSTWKVGRRATVLVAVAAMAVAGFQLSQPTTAVAEQPSGSNSGASGGTRLAAMAVGGLQLSQPTLAFAAPPTSSNPSAAEGVRLGSATLTNQQTAPGCSKAVARRPLEIDLSPALNAAQVARVGTRLSQSLVNRPGIDALPLRIQGNTLTGTLVGEGPVLCGRRLQEIEPSELLLGVGADVAASAVYLTVFTGMLSAGLLAEANPAAAPATVYYLAFAGCVAGATSAAVRTQIVGSTSSQTIGAALGSCLSGAVLSAGVGRVAQDQAVNIAIAMRKYAQFAYAAVPDRVRNAVGLARASVGSSVQSRVIEAIPVVAR